MSTSHHEQMQASWDCPSDGHRIPGLIELDVGVLWGVVD